MPSFSSTLSLILSTLSVGSMSISISFPVKVCGNRSQYEIDESANKKNDEIIIIFYFVFVKVLHHACYD